MSSRLFHLVLPEAWRVADPELPWSPPSLASEGFLHLSLADQLPGTLEVHFDGVPEVWLLEVSPEGLGDALVHEPSRGGALFPHLYRALEREEVLRWWGLQRGSDGRLGPLDLGPETARPGPP